MDKLSGYECATTLSEYNKSNDDWVPIIFLSAAVDDEAVQQGIESGGDDYLTKPINTTILKSKILAMERIATMRNKLLESNERFETLSLTDALTGLPNRKFYEQMINSVMANACRNHTIFALLFIDLDKFKNINDTLGHHLGDLLLQKVSVRIRHELRQGDHITRLGGDEFAIILPTIEGPDCASTVANKIIASLAESFDLEGNEVSISCSVGVACYPQAGEDAETLTKNADIAMYRAKSLGRNTFQFFTEELNLAHSNKVKMEQALATAVSNDELSLVLQPKYQFEPKKIIGFEALLRWHHPEYGPIPPDGFIPVAEETGLIIPIGEWVIEHACALLGKINEQYKDTLTFAINISPVQVNSNSMLSLLQKCMKENNLTPAQLEIEITETAIMAYSNDTEQALRELHDLGIRIDIDDFGTGYSSLSHLKQLPINGLKIDKSFVMDIPKDENDIAIVKGIISLAKSLGLNITAEGIETIDQLQFLLDNGCSQGQGYYLSKPIPLDEAIALLKKQQ